MARSLGRKPIGFDSRTGFKTRHYDLIEDGEIPGLRVKRGTEDLEHPQRKLRRVGPDRQALWRPAPEVVIAAAEVIIGFESDADYLDSPRMATPAVPLYIGGFAITALNPATEGPFTFDTLLTHFDETALTWDTAA